MVIKLFLDDAINPDNHYTKFEIWLIYYTDLNS